MTVILRKTVPEDAEILARIWLDSLADKDMVKLASPEGITARRLKGATRKTLEDLEDKEALCITAYDEDTKDLMGCAVWRFYPEGKMKADVISKQEEAAPSVSKWTENSSKEDTLPAAKTPSISKDLDEASTAIFEKHVGKKPHAGKFKGNF